MNYTPIIQGAGQYQQTVFKGIFYTIDYDGSKSFQIRSKGKPHKRTGFKAADQGETFTVFTKDGERLTPEILRMLKKAEKLYASLEAKQLYISVINNKLYFAYESKSIPKRQHKRDCEQFEHLYKAFLNMINVVDILKEEDIFDTYSL